MKHEEVATRKVYLPYFEAVRQILDGTPVENLDNIREQCNEASPEASRQSATYSPGMVVATFVADAENKILMGARSVEIYGGFGELKPIDIRQRGRRILESMVDKYLE